ncbi:MAG: hydroxysqualene dehydroxylase HpnE [Ignavibacteriales bacterium]|nr:hydroxysqualene dehydroxylase HpnE [Ignavibacteriales bacterium]
MKTDVLIIGGGLSGLAAAVKLSQKGVKKITLVEASGKLGGRAYSFVHKETGDVIDNGQHVLVGAYKNTLEYLDIIGTRKFLSVQKNPHINFWSKEKGFSTFEIGKGKVFSSLRFKGLSLKSKLELKKVEKFFQKFPSNENEIQKLTVDEWLNSLHQSTEAKKNFWYPIAISVMNELPEKASALLFARSLKASFFSGEEDSSILISIIGQTELYVDGAVKLLKESGVEISLNNEVISFGEQNGKISKARFQSGEEIEANYFISCVPYFALERIIENSTLEKNQFLYLKEFQSSPIISIYFWFDKEIIEQEMLGVCGKNIQWIFNRNKIFQSTNTNHYCVSIVISAAYHLIEKPKEAIEKICFDDLREIFPNINSAKLNHSLIIKEKRATFSASPTLEAYRPNSKTKTENLFLAGDWINTGLPATIEGAIESGFKISKIF